MYAPRPHAPRPAAALRRALPALQGLRLAARVVALGALVGALSLVWGGGADVRAAPAIPARLDLAAARIVVEGTPISGQYLVVCQTAEGPVLSGPWALEAGLTAHFPVRLGVPCWVQVAEVEAVLAVWETPRYTLWRQHVGMVGNQGVNQ